MAFDFVTTSFKEEYATTTEMLMQQKKALYLPYVENDTFEGKAATVVEQFGETTAQTKTTRGAPTPNIDVPRKRPWIFPTDINWATQATKEDQLRSAIDPTSKLQMAGVAAMNRKMNEIVRTAFFATVLEGEGGTGNSLTSEAFDTTNYQVGVDVGGTASSLNVAKLQDAVRMHLGANEEELDEPLYAAISEYEHDALLKEIQVTNTDYSGSAVLMDGRVKRFMGIDFILDSRLNISSGNRLIPVWRASGMTFGTWDSLTAEIDRLPTNSYVWQVYLEMTIGAVRTEQGKVVQILCDDQI